MSSPSFWENKVRENVLGKIHSPCRHRYLHAVVHDSLIAEFHLQNNRSVVAVSSTHNCTNMLLQNVICISMNYSLLFCIHCVLLSPGQSRLVAVHASLTKTKHLRDILYMRFFSLFMLFQSLTQASKHLFIFLRWVEITALLRWRKAVLCSTTNPPHLSPFPLREAYAPSLFSLHLPSASSKP